LLAVALEWPAYVRITHGRSRSGRDGTAAAGADVGTDGGTDGDAGAVAPAAGSWCSAMGPKVPAGVRRPGGSYAVTADTVDGPAESLSTSARSRRDARNRRPVRSVMSTTASRRPARRARL
jgi:hypothetical protein